MILDVGLNCKIDLRKYEDEGLRIFITGQSGSGKSYLAKVIVEELADLKLPIIIIDPEGEYTAFKERYPTIIVGGRDGDLSYESFNLDLAVKIVEYVYNSDFQILIFDTSEKLSSEQSKIHSLILEAVFNVAGLKKTPCVFVAEEAHIIAPQTGGVFRSLDLSIEIAKRGRKRGLHSIWITQRPADVSKKVISQCNIRFFGRHQEPADINALRTYIRNLGIEEAQLMGLNKEFIFYSKDGVKRVKARALRIRDLGATPKGAYIKSGGDYKSGLEGDLKTVIAGLPELLKVKPIPVEVQELKEDEVTFTVLKKQLSIRDKLGKLRESKIKYRGVLDDMISKLDAGKMDSTQAEIELQKLKSEVMELIKLERNLYSEYKKLPYEMASQTKQVVERRLRKLEERRKEGRVSEEAYLELKEEYLSELMNIDERGKLFKTFVEREIADLNIQIQSLRKELEVLKAKREVGEYSEEAFKIKEKELAKTLEETDYCIKSLKNLLA